MKLAAIVYALSLTENPSKPSRRLNSYIPNTNQDAILNAISRIREQFSLYDTNDDGESGVVCGVLYPLSEKCWSCILVSLMIIISPLGSTPFSIGIITIEEFQAFTTSTTPVGLNSTVKDVVGIFNTVSWLLLRKPSEIFGTNVDKSLTFCTLSFQLTSDRLRRKRYHRFPRISRREFGHTGGSKRWGANPCSIRILRRQWRRLYFSRRTK